MIEDLWGALAVARSRPTHGERLNAKLAIAREFSELLKQMVALLNEIDTDVANADEAYREQYVAKVARIKRECGYSAAYDVEKTKHV